MNAPVTLREQIEIRLQSLNPHFLEVINESPNHHVPPGAESHFKVIIVSDAFSEDKNLLARHRRVYDVLKEEMKILHALSLYAQTVAEWEQSGMAAPDSPPCRGGSKE